MIRDIPVLALTPGEPAGIGPDLCVQIALWYAQPNRKAAKPLLQQAFLLEEPEKDLHADQAAGQGAGVHAPVFFIHQKPDHVLLVHVVHGAHPRGGQVGLEADEVPAVGLAGVGAQAPLEADVVEELVQQSLHGVLRCSDVCRTRPFPYPLTLSPMLNVESSILNVEVQVPGKVIQRQRRSGHGR